MRALVIIKMVFDFLGNVFNILLIALPIIGVFSFIAAYTSAVFFEGEFLGIGNAIARVVLVVWLFLVLLKILWCSWDFFILKTG